MTTIQEFQDHVNGFKKSQLTKKEALANWSLGLSGECGETVDLIKKYLFHNKGLDRDALIKELGDVFWYLFALCDEVDVDVEYVLSTNVEKLTKRHEGKVFNIDVANENKTYERS